MRSKGDFKIAGGWDKLLFLLAGVSTLLGYLYLPAWYYHILKCLICGISIYGMFLSKEKIKWLIIFCVLGVIYNPLISVMFFIYDWRTVDLISACIFFVFFCKSCMYKKFWKVSVIIIWSAFFSFVGLIHYVDRHFPHGPEYDTGVEDCPDDGDCSEVYKEDLRGVNIPKWAKSFKNEYMDAPLIILLLTGLIVWGSKLTGHKTVTKIRFSGADSNGATILENLIKKGVLEEFSPTEVRLNRFLGEEIKRPLEMQSSNFNEIWRILEYSPGED